MGQLKVWRDREGKTLSIFEFISRLKEGIIMITPYQQSKNIFINTWVIIAGIIFGIIFTSLNLKNFWWVTVILLGALGNTIITQIGNYQKYKLLKSFETSTDGLENE